MLDFSGSEDWADYLWSAAPPQSCGIYYEEIKKHITYIFKIIISFLAAFRTFLPSFLWNFLQVYIFKVFLSLARNISQNSSLWERREDED